MKTKTTWEKYKQQRAQRRRNRTTPAGKATLWQKLQRTYHKLSTPSRWVNIGVPLAGLDTAQEEQ